MAELGDRYQNPRFRFLDNIVRHRGVLELADEIEQRGRTWSFFYELRAQIHPYELVRLWEAGCDAVQIGLEGLSTAYLRRINKGTSTIQNLQAMKTCFELGMRSGSNLIVDFPGATKQEVDETERNVRRYALAYEPAHIARFRLYRNSGICRRPEAFGLSAIRNAAEFRAVLPEEVCRRLDLFWLDFDCEGTVADWSGVERACATWRQLHDRLAEERGSLWHAGARPLYYLDGGNFLEVVDRRDDYRVITLPDLWRELYLHCMEIRKRREVIARFAHRAGAAELDEMLSALAEQDLVFEENGRVLALAVATRPQYAAARIRSARRAWRAARGRADRLGHAETGSCPTGVGLQREDA
jgi:hypothetical protein